MAETLFIFCPEPFTGNTAKSASGHGTAGEDHGATGEVTVTWGMITGERPLEWKQSTIGAIPATSENTRVCVVLPGEQILLSQVTLNGKNARHLQQALPYLVEESLASDVESMHIVRGAVQPDDRYPVAAIDTQLLEQTLGLFKTAGIHIDRVIPDTLLLPWSSETITVLVAKHRCLLRYSAALGLAIDDINLTVALECILLKGEFKKISVYHSEELEACTRLQLQALRTAHTVEIEELPQRVPVESFLSRNPAFSTGINLLQGKVALEHGKKPRNNHWRPLLTAAAILLAINTLYDLGTGVYLEAQAEAHYQRSETLYRQYFPDDKRIINIKTQTEAHLHRQKAGAEKDRFLLLMGRFGLAWQGKQPEGLNIQQLRFDKQRGQLILDVEATSIQQLEQFRQQLIGHRLSADLLSANEEQQHVRGRLQLSEAR